MGTGVFISVVLGGVEFAASHRYIGIGNGVLSFSASGENGGLLDSMYK